MTIRNNHHRILISSLKSKLNLPHQHCTDLVKSHIQYIDSYYNIHSDLLSDNRFLKYLEAQSSKLKDLIETSSSTTLAIIANQNYNALLPTELSELYDFSLDTSVEENDHLFLIRKFGTLEQIFSSTIMQEKYISFHNDNFRELFTSYINVHQRPDGRYLVVFRELDTLLKSASMQDTIEANHLKAIVRNLINTSKRNECISAISFENINNEHSLHQVENVFDDSVGEKADSNLHELMNFVAKRNVLTFDCS